MSNLSTTTNNLYRLYVESVIDLAQSVVIKYDQIAEATNKSMFLKTGIFPDPEDRLSWKYYQNISGIYHFSDSPMQVYSLDANELIDFSVASLVQHPITKTAYRFGTPLYTELLSVYPDQENLILGILTPANIDYAIASKPGTILSYPKHLIESNEIDLLAKMQDWVYAYTVRWINTSFSFTDDLYSSTYYAQLCLNLIPLVMNLRLGTCKTNQSHSFHSKQFLRSHGFLDTYLDQLTARQALNMVRNIAYYERNAGFERTFNSLIDIVMSEAGLPAYEYIHKHNTEPMSRSNLFDNQLYPKARFKRKPLNELARKNQASDYTLAEVLSLSATLTPNNDDYQINNYAEIRDKFEHSNNSKIITKTIECSLNPINTPTQLLPETLLFGQWVYLASTEQYSVPVLYLPKGAPTPLRLSQQEALALWVYAGYKATEARSKRVIYPEIERVPTLLAQRVIRPSLPALAELTAMTNQIELDPGVVSNILSTAISLPPLVSSLIKFTELCQSIFNASKEQFKLFSFVENPQGRAYAQAVVGRLYMDVPCVLATLADPESPALGIRYTELITKIGLDLTDYRPIDYFVMADQLFNAATGANANALLDPNNIQKSMISLMSYLSSYSIQFVSTGLASSRVSIPRPDIRTYHIVSSEDISRNIDMPFTHVRKENAIESASAYFKIPNLLLPQNVDLGDTFKHVDVRTKSEKKKYSIATHAVGRCVSNFKINNTFDPKVLFNSLSLSQQATVVDLYRPQ